MRKLAYFFILLCMNSFVTSAQTNKQIIVVIDPGHGGSDPGHLPNNTNLLPEKDLNLKISNYLGGYIETYLQNVKVVYTRTSDTYPSLAERVDKANNLNADYFISVHCNGNENVNVHGTESHVHSMELTKSVAFAKEIESQFSKRAGRKSRGVKDQNDLQHSLQVLKFTNMTSVLVECGFLTNDAEAAFLNTKYGQEIVASAVFRAFRTRIEAEYPNTTFRKSQPSTTPASTETANSNTTASTTTTYAIQIASTKTPVDPKTDPNFKKLEMEVTRKELNTTSAYKYIYLVGSYASKEEATKALEAVKTKGFGDAIVVKT